MKTPSGFDCPHFYGDYRRGRNTEECRILANTPLSQEWSSKLCATCAAPGIIRANACPNMELKAEVVKQWFGLKRKIKIISYCTLSQSFVEEPYVGCGQCHPLPPVFTRGTDDSDSPARS